MKLLEKLAQLANELDAKGCVDEASAIDDVIKTLAVDWGKIDKHFEGKLNKNVSPAHIQNIKNLRVELGLPAEPAVFDRAVADVLRAQYPGVWVPRSGQKATDILGAVRDAKSKNMDFAGQPGVFGPGGINVDQLSGDVGIASKGPKMTAPGVPQVELGDKPDAQLPPQEFPKDVPAKSLKDLEPPPVSYK